MTTLMKTTVLAIVGNASVAHAAVGQGSGTGFVTYLFLGFLALIVACQMIPGLMLFFGMLKGLFASVPHKQTAPTEPKTNKVR
jgi:hypothetical protein